MHRSVTRRAFLRATLAGAALPLAAPLLRPARAAEPDAAPTLSEASPTAQALAYVADASRVDRHAFPGYAPGQTCRNCSQYVGDPGDARGGCQLVLGEFVLAGGWCKAWAAPAKG